jgi:hypothetical protein
MSLRTRVKKLEKTVVRCRACAAASREFVRFIPDAEFEALERGAGWREVCRECGLERTVPVKIYPEWLRVAI